MNLSEIGKALVAINRSAHRSNRPGICKCKLQIKNLVLNGLAQLGLLRPEAQQTVNRRVCYVLKLEGTDYSFHCPLDHLPAGIEKQSLPELPPLEKAQWGRPPMSFDKARQVILRELGLAVPHVKLLTCPQCGRGWRYDLLTCSTPAEWARATSRTCPDCWRPRTRWYRSLDEEDELFGEEEMLDEEDIYEE